VPVSASARPFAPTPPARFARSRGSGLRCCRSNTAEPTPTSRHSPKGYRRKS
jgi:hypothetical protein